MKIKFTKNHPDAVMPKRATSGAAGFDLTADRPAGEIHLVAKDIKRGKL